jgi:CBS domain-containing protein
VGTAGSTQTQEIIMNCGEICNREVVVARRDAKVSQAAKLMREHDVGSVVIVEGANGAQKPIGILTDRDIVLDIVRKEWDRADVPVSEIMCQDLVLARETDDLNLTVEKMRDRGVRRVPVVDDQGLLKGILSSSDVMEVLAEGIAALADLHVTTQRPPAIRV